MYKMDLEKSEEPEIKSPKFIGSQKKQGDSRKNTYFCFIDYTKAFHNVDHNKLPKTRKEKGMPGHPTFLLRNMHAGLEGKIETRYATMDWFKIWKRVHQGCRLSLCSLNLYAEYIM